MPLRALGKTVGDFLELAAECVRVDPVASHQAVHHIVFEQFIEARFAHSPMAHVAPPKTKHAKDSLPAVSKLWRVITPKRKVKTRRKR
jgi:hypothetical protein